MYINTSRELKRLDSLAYSPIFSRFSDVSSGLLTIRAFGKQEYFDTTNLAAVELSNRVTWPLLITSRWLSIRLELLSAAIVLVASVLVTTAQPRQSG